MGHWQSLQAVKLADRAWDNTQTLHAAALSTAIKHELQPQTYAKERLA